MEQTKMLKVIGYYKQTLANVLEENFMHQATISELQNELQKLKMEIEKLKNDEQVE